MSDTHDGYSISTDYPLHPRVLQSDECNLHSTRGIRMANETADLAPACRRKSNFLLTLSAPCLILLALTVATTARAADRFDGVRSSIRAQMQERNVRGMSVAVAKNGKIVWAEGFGWADLESRIPATADTSYSLASISKTFTAVGLMTLVQAGKVDLDRPINDYLGDAKLEAWVGDAREATVRRVANHTSGLGTSEQFFYGEEERRLIPSMDQSILRYGKLYQEPGTHWDYNNFGYGLLGYVIERVSGQPYADYMRQSVYQPLGMTHSSIDIAPGLESVAAARYGNNGERIPFYGFQEPGAAAMYSSVSDLARFGMFYLGHRQPGQREILSKASRAAMIRNAVRQSPTVKYGVGLQIAQYGDYIAVQHAGSMSGVKTKLSMVPSEDLVVVVVGNTNSAPSIAIHDEIMQLMLPGWTGPASETMTAPAPAPAPQAWQGEWAGTLHAYEKELPIQLKVLASGDVHVRIADQLWSLLDKANFKDGRLTGRSLSQIPTGDTSRRPHTVRLTLQMRGGEINGEAMAGSLDPYFVYGLNHWVSLRRVKADPPQ